MTLTASERAGGTGLCCGLSWAANGHRPRPAQRPCLRPGSSAPLVPHASGARAALPRCPESPVSTPGLLTPESRVPEPDAQARPPPPPRARPALGAGARAGRRAG